MKFSYSKVILLYSFLCACKSESKHPDYELQRIGSGGVKVNFTDKNHLDVTCDKTVVGVQNKSNEKFIYLIKGNNSGLKEWKIDFYGDKKNIKVISDEDGDGLPDYCLLRSGRRLNLKWEVSDDDLRLKLE